MNTYFKSFATTAEEHEWLDNNNYASVVTYVAERDSTKTIVNPAYVGKDLSKPFTITALDNNTEVYVHDQGQPFYYSLDGGQTWTHTGWNVVDPWGNEGNWTLNANESVCIKMDLAEGTHARWDEKIKVRNGGLQHRIKISGNVLSLYDAKTYYKCIIPDHEITNEETFARLFYDCSALVDASELILPCNLKPSCYTGTFSECDNLEYPPEHLPAKGYKNSCYANMFGRCTSLVSVPHMYNNSNMRIYERSMNSMFYLCREITSVENLGHLGYVRGEESEYAMLSMFGACSSLVTAPQVDILGSNSSSASGMFAGCSSLTDASGIHIENKYGMWDNPFEAMFYDCSSLDHFEIYGTEWPQLNSTMFDGCAENGTFTVPAVTNYDPNDYIGNGIPSGWTIQRAS